MKVYDENGNQLTMAAFQKELLDADDDTGWQVEQSTDEDKIHGKVAGVEAFLLDDVGILTLVKQSAFSAYRSTSQTITSGSGTKILFNAELFDIQGEFDAVTNHRFTATKAGIYLFAGGVSLVSLTDGTRVALTLWKNGASGLRLADIYMGGAGTMATTGAGLQQVSIGDYYELYIWHNDSASRDINPGSNLTYFHGVKVA